MPREAGALHVIPRWVLTFDRGSLDALLGRRAQRYGLGVYVSHRTASWIASCLLVAGLPAQALEGRYRVEGQNPGQAAQTYRGEAVVKRTGETYSLVWQIGAGRQIGTGLLTGSVLSVVFQSVGSQGGGVASFETANDRIVGGRWTLIGGQTTGTERWTREP